MATPMRHLALNVYFWGDDEQNRLLTDCLGPAARELWEERSLRRFWVHRFDARGPHLMTLLGFPADHAEEARRHLAARLDLYLVRSPSTAVLTAQELQARHDACRGSRLSSLDARGGFATNNSYAFAPQPADAFPYRRVAGREEEAELNDLLGELTFWCVEQVRAGTATVGAIRWIAALDRAIARAGRDPGCFWQWYAATLLPTLGERIAGGDAEVAALLERRIGERNRTVFDTIWSAAGSEPPAWPGAYRLAELALGPDAAGPAHQWPFTRDLVHAVLAQLGLHVMSRIPLVLYAWLRGRHAPLARPLGSPA